MTDVCGVYEIVNTINGKRYIATVKRKLSKENYLDRNR